jgi:hypothetical protein
MSRQRIKPEEVAIRAQRSAERAARHAALQQELTWVKSRQWTVAASTMSLLGAIFGAVNSDKFTPLVNGIFVLLAWAIAAWGSLFLWDLQNHLASTRRRIDPKDKKAWDRGSAYVYGPLFAFIAFSFAILFSAWKPIP